MCEGLYLFLLSKYNYVGIRFKETIHLADIIKRNKSLSFQERFAMANQGEIFFVISSSSNGSKGKQIQAYRHSEINISVF